MGVLSWLGLTESATTQALSTELAAERANVDFLRESMADLELAMEDAGWDRLTAGARQEFTREGLGRAAEVARVLALSHPLVKRGLNVRAGYIWGQGVEVQARANGDDGAQDVNAVVQAFWDDEGNRAALTGAQAQEELERALGTDGNVFLACFTSPLTGFVQVRSIPFDEIVDIVANPDDRDDPWYYKRVWTERTVDMATATVQDRMRTAYYPAITYRPSTRLRRLNDHDIMWDAPIKHVSVNKLDGWAFGIGDAYAAISWARGYRDFLADWAVLVKALSQFAFRATEKGSKAQAMRAALTRRPAPTAANPNAPAGNPNTVGATAVMSPGATLEAIPKTGATIDSESGRPLAAMIAAGLGVPVTILLADPGVTGARATAETLDQPTRLEMGMRRNLWGDTLQSIFTYVIKQAVKAPRGPLRGTITRDAFTGREALVLAGDTDATVEIEWPPLDELPMATIVEAIVAADGTGKLPPEQTVKLLLQALNVKDVDEILADFLDENGRFIDPYVTAGQAAVDAFRRGEDPAEALR